MTHKLNRNGKPLLKIRNSMTENDRNLLKSFLSTFESFKVSHVEIRVTNQQVKDFLSPYEVTFSTFNHLASCLGRTTNNMYCYSVPIILSLAEPPEQKHVKFSRSFPVSSKIKTINYYGSKRRWLDEYKLILAFASHKLGCSQFVDCFAGSAILSLLASKLECFDTIIANEISPAVFNYHAVLKEDAPFQSFIDNLAIMPHLNRDAYSAIRTAIYNPKDFDKDASFANAFEGREIRVAVQSVDVMKALYLYLIKHYAFQCQGGFASTRVPAAHHIPALIETHKLYQKITLNNLYYKKVLSQWLPVDGALIFLDPPYLRDLRSQKASYEQEFSFRKHRTLMQLLSRCCYPSKIILCGYKYDDTNDDLYSRYLLRSPSQWHCYRFCKSSVVNEDRAKEFIWTNFDMLELCDNYPQYFEIVF